jgi:hypothetical protein
MFKLSHVSLIVISGFIWLAVGCFLLPLGLNFIVELLLQENWLRLSHPLLTALSPLAGGAESAALVLIILCLFLGYLKGRYIFGKSVQRGVERILSLPNPTSLKNIYTAKYYILLGSMVFLGFIVRFAPLDVRGAVDVTIGSALINGAMLYFRYAAHVRRQARMKA